MDASVSPTRVMTSILHVFGREPPSGMRNSGMTGKRSSSICWCPSRLTFPNRPANTSPKSSGSMSAFAIWLSLLLRQDKAGFHPGKRIRHKANHCARLRKRLQQKGTRGSKRRLRRIEQRERRLKAQANHCIAKQIITQHPHALIGLENLTDIRERTKRRKRRRKKNGKGTEPVSPKARKANRVYSQWSFAELQALISYKAALAGSLALKVDADYTSKACPMCGHTCDANRPHKGLRFVCQNKRCGYTLHPDLIGARNVTMRTLLVRHDWIRTGCLSLIPDASDKEAKAARLQRYAELWWSPDGNTSLRSLTGGS